MTLLIPHITQAQASAVINVLIVFLQYTLALTFVTLLVYFVSPVNSALAWNVIGRSLHNSLWPTLLRTDSSTARGTGFRVALFSYLSFVVTVLVAVAGVLMPLGLSAGPALLGSPKNVTASFVADTSALGRATSPREDWFYSRTCGAFQALACPGNLNGNTTMIAPDLIARFNATPYGPFGIQARRYYIGAEPGYDHPMIQSRISTTESLILRNGIFAVEGAIVDMDNPGIGFRNHTFPADMPQGGVWSEDILWLEPATACVDTNLTLDYLLSDGTPAEPFNLTDRGGFFNLTHDYPAFKWDGQNIDLWHRAYRGAVLSNFASMGFFNNLTRNESQYGRTFPLPREQGLSVGHMKTLRLWYLVNPTDSVADYNSSGIGPDLEISCQGYGGADTANITNVGAHCSILLAPPQRLDGGDPRLPSDNSTWTQRMFSCVGATRARMQRIRFSFNGTMSLNALSISRSNLDTPVLWATEKTNLSLADVDILWGRIPDNLEEDPSLWTTRSDVFYVPAGNVDFSGPLSSVSGQASTLPGVAWGAFEQLDTTSHTSMVDYSGDSNFAMLSKFQTLISADPLHGPSQVLNLVWTDLMANNAVGTASRSNLLVQENVSSTAYDLRFAVPAFLLFVLWVPLFGGCAFILITGMLKFSYVQHLLNHTGAGRIALGNSALKPINPDMSSLMVGTTEPGTLMESEDEKHWIKGAGRAPLRMQPAGRGVPYSGTSTEFTALSLYEN
ncbi:hypothetical protein B0H19DRAFT_1109875 [Mycena capillaripes]|nr:hypothetical protein B0H19DRAFT_1109875 [Mycena capillaripes]